MRQHPNGFCTVLAILICSAGPASAQRARPATAAQPSSSTAAQPVTTMEPGEATTGRTTAPAEPSTSPGQAGTTPGREQTTPGQASELTPAVTGQTPSGQTTAKGQASALSPVTRTDLKAGSSVYDTSGAVVGKIESVSANGAVISTGTTRATIPVLSFAKGDKGLVIAMSKADIDAAAKKKSPN